MNSSPIFILPYTYCRSATIRVPANYIFESSWTELFACNFPVCFSRSNCFSQRFGKMFDGENIRNKSVFGCIVCTAYSFTRLFLENYKFILSSFSHYVHSTKNAVNWIYGNFPRHFYGMFASSFRGTLNLPGCEGGGANVWAKNGTKLVSIWMLSWTHWHRCYEFTRKPCMTPSIASTKSFAFFCCWLSPLFGVVRGRWNFCYLIFICFAWM